MGEMGQGGTHVVIIEGVSAPRRANYADLEALPESVIGEIVGGVLYATPRPAVRHALATSALMIELGGPFHFGRGGPGGWWILYEPELHLGEEVLVPDLAGLRRERMPAVPDSAALTIAPNWVCEVLSPSTVKLDRAEKLPRYAGAGVEHAWIVDPANRSVEVFDLRSGRPQSVAVFGGEDRICAEPFAEVEIALSSLWGG